MSAVIPIKDVEYEHPLPGDSSWKLLRDLTQACFTPQGVPARARAALWLWGVSVAVMPPQLGRELVRWRFLPTSRPELLKRSLRSLGVVKQQAKGA